MTLLLDFFILIPIAGFILSLLIPGKNEHVISWVVYFTVGIHFASFLVFIVYWLSQGHPTLNLKDIVLFHTDG